MCARAKNISTIVTLFATALLPTLVSISNKLVGITGAIALFAATHPGVMKVAATLALVATAAALVIGPLMMLAGAIGAVSVVMGALDVVSLPVVAIVLAIAAAVAGVVLIITHWNDITRAAVAVWNGVAQAFRVVWEIIQKSPLGPFVNQALLPFKLAIDAIGQGLKMLPALLKTVGDAAAKVAGPIKAVTDAVGKVPGMAGNAAGDFLNWAGASKADNPFIAHPAKHTSGGDTHHHTEVHHHVNHFHINGADAKTTEHLAKVVAKHVQTAQGRDLGHTARNRPLVQHGGLVPGY